VVIAVRLGCKADSPAGCEDSETLFSASPAPALDLRGEDLVMQMLQYFKRRCAQLKLGHVLQTSEKVPAIVPFPEQGDQRCVADAGEALERRGHA